MKELIGYTYSWKRWRWTILDIEKKGYNIIVEYGCEEQKRNYKFFIIPWGKRFELVNVQILVRDGKRTKISNMYGTKVFFWTNIEDGNKSQQDWIDTAIQDHVNKKEREKTMCENKKKAQEIINS